MSDLTRRRIVLFLLQLSTTLSFSIPIGCGGNDGVSLGRVTGRVTLDGAPLVGVNVIFSPAVGRLAASQTDSTGAYDLEYTAGTKGAIVGMNTVALSWPQGQQDVKPIPPRYSTKSELKFDVKQGENQYEIKLESRAEDKDLSLPSSD